MLDAGCERISRLNVRPDPDRAPPPWRCPVCLTSLALVDDGRRFACTSRHSFDVAREGYVNLLLSGSRRRRVAGDSPEMVAARRRFLDSGAYDPLSEALAVAVSAEHPDVVLDVGCGEGRHTRRVAAKWVMGVDVARHAVAAAARAHAAGWYAVASAASIPLVDGAADALLDVFGPVMPDEFARAVRSGGVVIAAHPGPHHLEELRSLVYAEPHPHEVKPPLRNAPEWFLEEGSSELTFPVRVDGPAQLSDLFTMTPYRWHAPPGIADRIVEVAASGFETGADIRVTVYRRTG